MGGIVAHEYMAPSTAGEDRVARCSRCDYAANVEMAASRIAQPAFPPPSAARGGRDAGRRRRSTRSREFLGIDPRTTSKAMPVVAGRRQGLARARARRPPPARAQAAQGARARRTQAGDAGGDRGGVRRQARLDRRRSASARARSAAIVADETLREGAWVAGANRTGWHLTGVEAPPRLPGRSSPTSSEVEDGDGCPLCDGVLRSSR